eukprot:TRINITY_DN26190_c0_g1_i1.p1 TRINITY_DN26190_c0_g1~~TRINITY_DN26190_c0_g1_i1.p1  ORF type:complete len:117 (+),score=30.38 TRINITY_DN26190_c0_g1_i1:3-353(+)
MRSIFNAMPVHEKAIGKYFARRNELIRHLESLMDYLLEKEDIQGLSSGMHAEMELLLEKLNETQHTMLSGVRSRSVLGIETDVVIQMPKIRVMNANDNTCIEVDLGQCVIECPPKN